MKIEANNAAAGVVPEIRIAKLTGVDLLRKANSFTTGRESKMSLRTAYRSLHSPCRTQLFTIEFEDIPLFVASQLVRSKVGVEWWMRSKRPDRGGADFVSVCNDICEELDWVLQCDNDDPLDANMIMNPQQHISELPSKFDRYAPTSLMCLINAEAIINMSHKRLCAMASKETREIWQKVCELMEECDPDLYPHLVKPCVACGVCRERCCGFIHTDKFREERENYKSLFV